MGARGQSQPVHWDASDSPSPMLCTAWWGPKLRARHCFASTLSTRRTAAQISCPAERQFSYRCLCAVRIKSRIDNSSILENAQRSKYFTSGGPPRANIPVGHYAAGASSSRR